VLRALQGRDGRDLPPEASAIVMSAGRTTSVQALRCAKGRRGEAARPLPRSQRPAEVVIVTSKLLTGFDAPILQAMYLDKPMRDHTCCKPSAG
jgi:type I restriction enzyme R subunit